MFFFAYDLEDYKENLRGFYFDFVNEIPGPISQDTETLISDIKNYRREDWQEKYKAYHDKFNNVDCGEASKKIIELIEEKTKEA